MAKPKSRLSEGYSVGYGKPPRASQFRKGQSGNPAGRPKGKLNLATVLERTMKETVVITENGERKTITKLEAAVKQQMNKAASGDLHALKFVTQLAQVVLPEHGAETPASVFSSDEDSRVMQGLLERMGAMAAPSPASAEPPKKRKPSS